MPVSTRIMAGMDIMRREDDHPLYHTESRRTAGAGGYQAALARAASDLAGTDMDDLPRRTGAAISARDGGRIVEMDFLGDRVAITLPGADVAYRARDGEMPLWARILVLHYLARAGGALQQGIDVTFRDLEGGREYFPAFEKRTTALLLRAFGSDPARFVTAGLACGGTRAAAGDHAVRFTAFPRVEVTFILWEGDDEFPPSGSVLFDLSIADYLSAEDVAVLCNMLAVSVIRAGTDQTGGG
jgi:hypothetical protein